ATACARACRANCQMVGMTYAISDLTRGASVRYSMPRPRLRNPPCSPSFEKGGTIQAKASDLPPFSKWDRGGFARALVRTNFHVSRKRTDARPSTTLRQFMTVVMVEPSSTALKEAYVCSQ